jgi:hypothetical protein
VVSVGKKVLERTPSDKVPAYILFLAIACRKDNGQAEAAATGLLDVYVWILQFDFDRLDRRILRLFVSMTKTSV